MLSEGIFLVVEGVFDYRKPPPFFEELDLYAQSGYI